MVVPKEKAQAVGGFPAGVTICEDHEFWTRLALAYPVVLSSSILTRYHVDVPGQAAEYWQKGYKENFEILPYHRFLAEELKKRVFNTEAQRRGGPTEEQGYRSFEEYCRKEFEKCLLQRLYWENFQAASDFYYGLGLNEMRLGSVMMMCGWIAKHPGAQPFVHRAMRLIKRIRERV